MESTANGTGNYFHQECERAKRGESDKEFLFIPWYEIEMYAIPVEDPTAFAASLDEYEISLWRRGATLEAIAWYRQKRREYADHADMMAEYPSDDVEAFNHSGERVFDIRQVQRLRESCRPPTGWVKCVERRHSVGSRSKSCVLSMNRPESCRCGRCPMRKPGSKIVTSPWWISVAVLSRPIIRSLSF